KIMQDLDREKALVRQWDSLAERKESVQVFQEFADEGEPVEEELQAEKEKLIKETEALELKNMLRGEDDHRTAVVTFKPGAGGTESQDWAEMLFRMYNQWAKNDGYDVSVMEYQ